MKGEIDYTLWTVMGDVIVHVKYEVIKIGNKVGVGHIEIGGNGEKPPEIDNEDVQREIIQACMEDMKRKEESKKSGEDVIREQLKQFKSIPGTDWGVN